MRDRRRIDPESGKVRPETAAPSAGAASSGATSAGATSVGAASAPGSPADGGQATGGGAAGTVPGAAFSGLGRQEPAADAAGTVPGTDGAVPGTATPDVSAQEQELSQQLAERTADLQRINAEYQNFRRRTRRELEEAQTAGTGRAITALLPVLDTIDKAEQHGDLTGAFFSVAEELRQSLGKLGLVGFGAVGEEFDPNLHEAVAHLEQPGLSRTECIDVMRKGYQLGEKLLRPAMVAVGSPPEDAPITELGGEASPQAPSPEAPSPEASPSESAPEVDAAAAAAEDPGTTPPQQA